MKSEIEKYRLEDLAKFYLDRNLLINKEYQRGATWTVRQQRSLIDSILRGFVLPIFYVHVLKTRNLLTGTDVVTAWLVDGQQRLNAITDFMRGRFALNDPTTEGPGIAMAYERMNPPRWAGKRYNELNEEDRKRFLDHPLSVVKMEEEASNEVRDLFIRLQAGTPLNPQEKRDAWPGNFTLFVIRHAGKDEHPESSPHAFFDLVRHSATKPADDDDVIYVDRRSKTRKFFAGLAMTFLVRRESDLDFVDLKATNVDAFYLNKTQLSTTDAGAVQLLKTLDEICRLPEIHRIRDGNKLKFQWAFHLVFLIDSLISGEYVEASWRGGVIEAFEQFRADCASATKAARSGTRNLHYTEFVQLLSGSGSDTADTIRRRQQFLLQEIIPLLRPRSRDPHRAFGELDREIIWYRQGGKCAHPECKRATALSSMHAHHVTEHSQGGATATDNGVLLCRACHQNRTEMQALESVFRNQIEAAHSATSVSTGDEPDETERSGAEKLTVEINWPKIGKGSSPEVLSAPIESDTVVAFCDRLIDVFGDDAVRWMTDRPVLRYPISKNPQDAFRNPVTGRPYPFRQIGSTQYYVCTLASQEEKLRRLPAWVAALPEPINSAIKITLKSQSQAAEL